MNGDPQDQQPQAPQESTWQYTAPAAPAQYVPPASQPPAAPQPAAPAEVSWTASEFIAHEKGANWYALLTVGAAALVGVTYLITRDMISVVVIAAFLVLFGVAAGRKPRTLVYQLDSHGLAIGARFYPYSEFKSFSIMQEHAISTISLLPLKRFMPPLSIYFDPKDEAHIVQVISMYLPFEKHEADIMDKAARWMRF